MIDKPLNICLLTSTFLPLVGGLELVVHNLATALTMAGHNVYVVTPMSRKGNMTEKHDYKLIRWGFKGYGRLGLATATAVATLIYVVKIYKIDVINFHNVYVPGNLAFHLNKFVKNVPFVGTPHGDDIQITLDINDGVRLDPNIDKIVRRNLEICKFVTAISPSIRSNLSDIGINPKKIIDIPNGIWIDSFRKEVNKSEVRSLYGIPSDAILMTSIGRNHPRKRFKLGLEAFANLRRKGYNLYFLLIGRRMGEIVEAANAFGVSDYLITPGQVDQEKIAQLLQASDIYVSSSIVESFGMTTLEAMAAGLPCVVTDVDGSRDLINHDCGILVEPGSSDGLTNGIEYLIVNHSARCEMGKKALCKADQFDWSKVSSKYLKAYQNTVS